MAERTRVTVDDLMRWSPVRSHFDAEELRQHPTYDHESDTIEVYSSHADAVRLNCALNQLSEAALPALRDATKALKRFAASCNAVARQMSRQLEAARRPSGHDGHE